MYIPVGIIMLAVGNLNNAFSLDLSFCLHSFLQVLWYLAIVFLCHIPSLLLWTACCISLWSPKPRSSTAITKIWASSFSKQRPTSAQLCLLYSPPPKNRTCKIGNLLKILHACYICVYISCFAHVFFWVRDKDGLTRSDGFNSIDCNPVASTAKSMFLEKRASINPHTIWLEIVWEELTQSSNRVQ